MSRHTTSSEQRSSDGSSQEPSAPVAQGRRWFMGAVAATAGGFLLGQLLPIQRPARPASEPAPADVDMLYHQSQADAIPDWGEQPERYKTYSQAKQIALPDPSGYGGPTLEETVQARRSRREYAGQSLSLEGLSRLLYAAQGITDPQTQLRAAPSAGALYPIEVYLAVQDVTGLDSGIYHYAVQTHALTWATPTSASFSPPSSSAHGGSITSGPTVTCCWKQGTSGRTCAWRLPRWVWGPVLWAPFWTMISTPCWDWTGRTKRRCTYSPQEWCDARIARERCAQCRPDDAGEPHSIGWSAPAAGLLRARRICNPADPRAQ